MSVDVAPPLLDPARLDHFADGLRNQTNARVDTEAIWSAFAAAFPGRPQGPEERRMLRTALDALVTRGMIRVPQTRRAWDASFGVEIPSWLIVLREAPPMRSRAWRSYAWHPRLTWVIDLARLTEDEENFLLRVQYSLVEGHFGVPAPVKYRSLQLLGHEKALETLLAGRLFAPGRLSLALLGCFADVPPAAWASVGDEPAAIVLENAGAFAVVRGVLAREPRPPYGIVVFGDGGRFERLIESLCDIGRPIARVDYVGDLDGAGLRIALGSRRAGVRVGLPRLEAAPGFHAMMLAAAARLGSPDGWPAPPGRRIEGLERGARELLPPSVVGAALAIIEHGRRIPEEVLAPEDVQRALCIGSSVSP